MTFTSDSRFFLKYRKRNCNTKSQSQLGLICTQIDMKQKSRRHDNLEQSAKHSDSLYVSQSVLKLKSVCAADVSETVFFPQAQCKWELWAERAVCTRVSSKLDNVQVNVRFDKKFCSDTLENIFEFHMRELMSQTATSYWYQM